jgi:hypothetical protein
MPLQIDRLISNEVQTNSLLVDQQNFGTQSVYEFFSKNYFGMGGFQEIFFSGDTTRTSVNFGDITFHNGVYDGSTVAPNLSISWPALTSVNSVVSGKTSLFNGVVYQDTTSVGGSKQFNSAMFANFGTNIYSIQVGNGDDNQTGEASIQKTSSIGSVRLVIRGDQDGFELENNTNDNTLDLFKVQNTSSNDIFNINSDGRTTVQTLNISGSTTPSSSGDTAGNIGDVTWDDSYMYVKTNTGWGRLQLDYAW